MMKHMGETQRVLVAQQMKLERVRAARKQRLIDSVWANAVWGVMGIVIAASVGLMFAFVIQDRIQKYPQLGPGIIPKTEAQRLRDAEPKRYVGR